MSIILGEKFAVELKESDCNAAVQQLASHFLEQISLKRLCQNICSHLSGRQVLDFNVFLLNSVLDEEISDINVPCSRAGRSSFINQCHGALVILKNRCWRDRIALFGQKITSPNDLRRFV